ncbi:MAG: hypothetical protein AAF449_13345 [Myxococcota bacterium]
MSRLLAQLCTVSGVRGAAVYDHSGVCLEHRLEPPYQPEYLANILDQLLVGLEAYEYIERAAIRFGIVKCADGVISVMRTRSHRAIALASNDINRSMLTVAFGALQVKLERLSEPREGPSVSLLATPLQGVSIDPAEIERMNPSELVSTDGLRATVEALADCLGPLARVLVQEQLAAMGLASPMVPRSLWPPFIESLAREISDAGERRRFIERTSSLT